MRKRNVLFFLPRKNLAVAVHVGLYRCAFIARSEFIPENIIWVISLFCQTVHRLLDGLCNLCFSARNDFGSEPFHQTAVVCFDRLFLVFFGRTDHIAWNFLGTAQIGQHAAEVGSAVSVDDHAVFVFLLHVTEKGASDPHFISAQGKREKILSLAVQSDISVVWKFQFLNWCMYHCFSSFILVSTYSRYFHGV